MAQNLLAQSGGGVGSSLKSTRYPGYVSKRMSSNFGIDSLVLVPCSDKINTEIQIFLHFSMGRAKMFFSRRGPKMSRRRVPTEIFGVSKFFYRKFVEKKFRGRGPQKSTFLGLFSKINPRNFCQVGKNVFFVLPIFLKNRGNGGVFLRVRPQNFFSSL